MTRTSLVVLSLFPLLSATAGFAQELEPAEKVKFDTCDGVKIVGKFYKSAKKAAPTVIMVHNIEETSNKENWANLAKALQPNFSVLTFDLRGHGESTEIDPKVYFLYPNNVKITRGAGINKTKLDWKDLDKTSYTVFINDIAAARAYLERTKNELEYCNVQNTIVVGSEQGATLAAVWANSEQYRYKFEITPPPFNQFRPESKSEGSFISAIVALSITPKLGNTYINLARTLELPCRTNAIPLVLVHSDGDPKVKDSLKDKEISNALDRAIKFNVKKGDTKYQFTKAVEIPKAGKLHGVDLLTKSLGTSENLAGYLKAIVADNNREWARRDFLNAKFCWKISNNPNVPPVAARVYNYPLPYIAPNPVFPPSPTGISTPLPDAVDRNLAYESYSVFALR